MFEMTLSQWLPAVSTTVLFAGALWLVRNLILNRLSKSVSFEFEKKLEILRAKLRETDESFKADLRVKETEISLLRSGALSAMLSQQVALDKRRLEAVDQLWASYNSFNNARWITNFLKVIKFAEVAKATENDPKAREVFKVMGAGFDLKLIDNTSAAKSRPFVSVMVWATYTAYVAICYHAIARWQALVTGFGPNLIDNESTKKLILVALPEYASYFDEFGPDSYSYVLEVLETKLLQEIQVMLTGKDVDHATIVRASEILKASNQAMEQVKQPSQTFVS